MKLRLSTLTRLGLVALMIGTLAACGGGSNGSDGAPGATGATGTTGATGPAGADKTTGTVDAKNLTVEDLQNRALGGKILAVDTSGVQPKVTFQVTMADSGEGVRGLGTFSLHIAQLQPEKNGSASYWLNYLADGLPLASDPAATSAKVNPSTDSVSTFNADGTLKAQGYSVVDNGDGTYVVTFGAKIKDNTKVIYDAALTHRVVVGVRSVVVPGVVGKTAGAYAGPINPATGAVFASFTNTNGVNLVTDFTPSATGPGTLLADAARDNVTIAACNQCHYKLQYGSNNTSGHLGSRTDTKTCVMCHTPQNNGAGTVVKGTGDFTPFIHQIHMGEELPAALSSTASATNYALAAAIPAADVTYPQDIRNCVQCHKGTITDNWKKRPVLKACGACHNNIDFTKPFSTGGHVGGVQADANCANCHSADDITINHTPVEVPDPNNVFTNTAIIPGTTSNLAGNNNTNASNLAAEGILPTGATRITYVVSSVTKNSSGNPTITFKFQKQAPTDAAPVDVVFNTYAAGVTTEMMNGFVGSPSIYFAWSESQDAITNPADYNATASAYIKNLWRGDNNDIYGAPLSATSTSKGTMVKNADGTYTVTLTNVNLNLPSSSAAKMLVGGIGYTYGLGTTMPLTQIDLPAYPYTPNPKSTCAGTALVLPTATCVNQGVGGVGGLSVPPPNVWKTGTGFTGRRLIVDTAKCNTCHGALGVKPTFHAGQRNDAQTCTFCHSVNRTNSGWPVNINYDVHAIHGAGKRTNKFSWEATAGAKFWDVGYPGILKNCEQCHLPNTYDFSATASASAVPNLLMTTAANGTIAKVGDAASGTAGDTRTIASVGVTTLGTETYDATHLAISPFVTAGTAYGAVYSFNANTGVKTEAAATTLALTPISAACSGCHDTATARAHMENNGGAVFRDRTTALGKTEQCLTCHGALSTTNVTNDTTPAIKAVHRWW